MSPKKALLILSPFIALLILSFIMVVLGQFNATGNKPAANLQDGSMGEQGQLSGQDINNMPEEDMEKIIEEKIEEKKEEIQAKPSGQPFTQEQIDFLVNPRKAVMEELVEESSE